MEIKRDLFHKEHGKLRPRIYTEVGCYFDVIKENSKYRIMAMDKYCYDEAWVDDGKYHRIDLFDSMVQAVKYMTENADKLCLSY